MYIIFDVNCFDHLQVQVKKSNDISYPMNILMYSILTTYLFDSFKI